jgi:ABC-type multidrug transport system fused ATPase/permease subunit
MNAQLTAMYMHKKRSYWGRHGGDVVFAMVPLTIITVVMIMNSYDSMLKQARSNWANNKCNPLYMPFAGQIMPQPGQSAGKTTAQNFDYCIQNDISSIFGVILMPLEFLSFMMINTLDLMVQGMVGVMKLRAYIASMLKTSAKETNNQLGDFIVAITMIIVKVRDAMARTSATILTGVLTTYTVYNIIVSGLMNITTIVLELLISFVIAIAGLFLLGSIFCMTPFTFYIGLGLYVIAIVAINLLFWPTLWIYILIQVFMTAMFGKAADPNPTLPVR